MKTFKLKDMKRGWFIGNFEPSVIKTEYFEVSILTHHKDEKWPKHYHKLADEITVLISGHMKMNGTEIFAGDIILIEKNEITVPEFLDDCVIVCVKIPSVIGDKYEID